jgi:hypothetical protein
MASPTFRLALTSTPLQAGGMVLHLHAAIDIENLTGDIAGVPRESWRVDETYVRVKCRWFYLHRAIDPSGATIDFFLSTLRSAHAAQALSARLRPLSWF